MTAQKLAIVLLNTRGFPGSFASRSINYLGQPKEEIVSLIYLLVCVDVTIVVVLSRCGGVVPVLCPIRCSAAGTIIVTQCRSTESSHKASNSNMKSKANFKFDRYFYCSLEFN